MSLRSRRGSLIAGVLFASILSFSVTSSVDGTIPAANAAGLGAGGEYHPLTPTRIFDTRPQTKINSSGSPLSTTVNGGAVSIPVLGQGNIPATASDVLAVAVSFTVTNPARGGFLTVYPTGSNPGTSSVLNFAADQTVPNLSILTVGSGGSITAQISGNVGTADVLVDVFGWFSTSTSTAAGARLIPVSPARIFDSREAVFRQGAAPLAQGESVPLAIRGADAKNPDITDVVPNNAEVTGVVINVTGINDQGASSNTFVSALPAKPTGPVTTSNLNLVPGQVKANLVIVPVGADGNVWLYNNAGNTHVAVDVVGYMRGNQNPDTKVGRVIPLTAPFRSFDTREAAFGSVPLGAGQSETWSFSQFVSSVTLDGQAVGNQIALIGNITGTGLTRGAATVPANTFFTLYPSDAGSRPFSSNINVTEGVDVPNLAVVKLSADNSIQAYNNAGNLHYVFDVAAVVLND